MSLPGHASLKYRGSQSNLFTALILSPKFSRFTISQSLPEFVVIIVLNRIFLFMFFCTLLSFQLCQVHQFHMVFWRATWDHDTLMQVLRNSSFPPLHWFPIYVWTEAVALFGWGYQYECIRLVQFPANTPDRHLNFDLFTTSEWLKTRLSPNGDSSKSFDMYEALHLVQFKYFEKDVGQEPETSTLQVISTWNWE